MPSISEQLVEQTKLNAVPYKPGSGYWGNKAGETVTSQGQTTAMGKPLDMSSFQRTANGLGENGTTPQNGGSWFSNMFGGDKKDVVPGVDDGMLKDWTAKDYMMGAGLAIEGIGGLASIFGGPSDYEKAAATNMDVKSTKMINDMNNKNQFISGTRSAFDKGAAPKQTQNNASAFA